MVFFLVHQNLEIFAESANWELTITQKLSDLHLLGIKLCFQLWSSNFSTQTFKMVSNKKEGLLRLPENVNLHTLCTFI